MIRSHFLYNAIFLNLMNTFKYTNHNSEKDSNMSSDHQDTRGFQPPNATVQLTGNNPSGFNTLRLPQTPSPKSPAGKTTSPESRIAAALGHAIFTIPSTSFQDAVAATTTTTAVDNHNPLRRTSSDTSSSFNQDLSTITTTTPPTLPEPTRRINPLRRTLSDPFSEYQPPQKTRTQPSRISPSPNPRTTPPPESSIRKQSPITERLRKMEDMVREIGRTCWDAMSQSQEHVEDEIPTDRATAEQEECIGVDRLSDGGLRIRLDCSCGKGFELLLKDNDYCFYRLT
ncbi:unnamed protein product [Lactuca saligna]|uniref:Uncharacterized protein n=1 Tax=Lactuca saligna TaxID=75948 RepID=A0AA35YMN6_LACSI|nr:unnamed protein product [Lactuca saligna]